MESRPTGAKPGMNRREFLLAIPVLALSAGLLPRVMPAQAMQTFNGPMLDANEVYRPVIMAAKPGAQASMTDAQRDDLEHRLACQCGCTLDVYTCRTTDFSCSVSPAMHADVMGLVAGGYSAQEIIDAFAQEYGEKVLMSPKREGFNWLGYVVPPMVMLGGTAVAVVLLRRWRLKGATAAPVPARAGGYTAPDATPDELARLERAVRGEPAVRGDQR